MVSNLRTGAVYTLANGTTALTSAGGMANALIALDGTTGAPTSTRVTLSQPIPLTGFTRVGVFPGWDRAVIFRGGRAYHVSPPDAPAHHPGAVPIPPAGPRPARPPSVPAGMGRVDGALPRGGGAREGAHRLEGLPPVTLRPAARGA